VSQVERIDTPDPVVYATDLAESIYHDISEESYLNFIKNLTSFGPRSIYNTTNTVVRNWLVSTLENVSNGRLEIEIWGSWYSIIAKLPGSLGNDAPAFMIGAHYDTVPGAPGANDDGSGVAACVELARVMSKYNWTNDIYFCLWNAEEYGLIGSRQCSTIFVEAEIDILIYFNVDMILVQDETAPTDERVIFYYSTDYQTDLADSVFTTYNDAQYWADLCRAMNNNFGNPIIRPVPHTATTLWTRSDQYSLWSVG
jgi:Zn-dependent M28 family amino/carboxypeptidase